MSLTNPTHAVTAERLQEFYGEIYPYLNGPVVELEKPFKVWDGIGRWPVSNQYTIETPGVYLAFAQPARGGAGSSIECTGEELYYTTITNDLCDGKLGIYRCEAGDILSVSTSGGNGSPTYYACIVNVNDTKFSAISLDAGETAVTTNWVLSKTSSTPGKKFIFAFAYRNTVTDATYTSINSSQVSYIEENDYVTYGQMERYSALSVANCILYKGDSVTASATNRRADNNDGWGASSVYIFSLV